MRKAFFLSIAALALLHACSVKEDHSQCLAPVSVHLSGFSVNQDDFPTTKTEQSATDYTSINNLTVAFYSGSTEVAKVT